MSTPPDRPSLAQRQLDQQQKNAQLGRENRELAFRLRQLDQMARSRVPRYLERIERDLVRGSLAQKLGLLSEVGRAVVAGAARLVPRDAEQQRFAAALGRRPERLQIAHSAFGGMGDALWSTVIIEAIQRKYPDADIHVFVYESSHADVFRHNPYVAGAYTVSRAQAHQGWPGFMRAQLAAGRLDAWFENRYATRVHYGARGRIPPAEQEETARAFAAVAVNFDDWPMSNNVLSTQARIDGRDLIGTVAASAALRLDDAQLLLYPSERDAQVVPMVERLGEFVTIHHGSDAHRELGHQQGVQQTKNWFSDRWEAVIAELKARTGLSVVQLGTANEQPLAGALHYFLGRTNWREAAMILQRARLHLDTEGGIVHLARAAHTPSLVLFGPTPSDFFGYAQNVNFKAGDCHDCWWTTEQWQTHCPRRLLRPACMEAITPAAVSRQIEALLARTAPATAARAIDERSIGELTEAEAWPRLEAQLGGRAPLALLEVGAAAGAWLREGARRGHRAQLCRIAATSAAVMAPSAPAASDPPLGMRWGSPFNLPYETGAFDVVLVPAPLAAAEYAPIVQRELARVLRPGGVLFTSDPSA